MFWNLLFGNPYSDDNYRSDDTLREQQYGFDGNSYGDRGSYQDDYGYQSQRNSTVQMPRTESDVYDLADRFRSRHGLDSHGMYALSQFVAHDALHEILGNGPDMGGEMRMAGAQTALGMRTIVEDGSGYEQDYEIGLKQGENLARQHPNVVRLLKRMF